MTTRRRKRTVRVYARDLVTVPVDIKLPRLRLPGRAKEKGRKFPRLRLRLPKL